MSNLGLPTSVSGSGYNFTDTGPTSLSPFFYPSISPSPSPFPSSLSPPPFPSPPFSSPSLHNRGLQGSSLALITLLWLFFRCEWKKAKNSSQRVCIWDYDGTGSDYQILAGPVFILVYTVSGIPLGFCAGVFHRRNLIVFCLVLWSAMTLMTGFATKYWHLVVTRFVLGIGWVWSDIRWVHTNLLLIERKGHTGEHWLEVVAVQT